MQKSKYKRIKLKDGTTRDEHRLVMEKHLGRKLERNEVVHHKDGNGRNNDLSNLELMSLSEHSKMHILKGETGWRSNKNNFIQNNITSTNTSGYLGVIKENHRKNGKVVRCIYQTKIGVNKKSLKIGRFRDPVTAAHYRDSATRFYKGEGYYLNFSDKQLLPPMSVEALRTIKKLSGI